MIMKAQQKLLKRLGIRAAPMPREKPKLKSPQKRAMKKLKLGVMDEFDKAYLGDNVGPQP